MGQDQADDKSPKPESRAKPILPKLSLFGYAPDPEAIRRALGDADREDERELRRREPRRC